jgi:hypothetical protein
MSHLLNNLLHNKLWLISQLVENHDGVRRQVVIPASAEPAPVKTGE